MESRGLQYRAEAGQVFDAGASNECFWFCCMAGQSGRWAFSIRRMLLWHAGCNLPLSSEGSLASSGRGLDQVFAQLECLEILTHGGDTVGAVTSSGQPDLSVIEHWESPDGCACQGLIAAEEDAQTADGATHHLEAAQKRLLNEGAGQVACTRLTVDCHSEMAALGREARRRRLAVRAEEAKAACAEEQLAETAAQVRRMQADITGIQRSVEQAHVTCVVHFANLADKEQAACSQREAQQHSAIELEDLAARAKSAESKVEVFKYEQVVADLQLATSRQELAVLDKQLRDQKDACAAATNG